MRTIEFNNSEYQFSWWSGQRLKGTAESPISFDLETELIQPYRPLLDGEKYDSVPTSPLHVPRPSLGMAYDGEFLCLIHPAQFAQFVAVHRGQHLVGHNIQFDFWCIHKFWDRSTKEILWQLADNNRLHDTMLMDLLLQLATGVYRHGAKAKAGDDVRLYQTNLQTLVSEFECGEIDKKDQYRLRFGELLDKSAAEIDAHPEANGFYEYALKDVLATWKVYKKQYVKGLEIMKRTGWEPNHKQKTYEIYPDAVERFGVLSEALQTKASIALSELSRTPININQELRAEREVKARERYQQALLTLLKYNKDLVKRYKSKKNEGEIRLTKRSLLPQFNQKVLVEILEAEAKRLNVLPPKSDGKKKGTSTSTKSWAPIAKQYDSEFISAWVTLEKESKLLQFLSVLKAPQVYSNYHLLKRTGRTSASAHKRGNTLLVPSINIQQMPRENPDDADHSIRELFLPPEGTKWGGHDYGYIELRALAAVCKARFGWSRLAEVIEEHTRKGGLDPHQKTAAAVLGITTEEFLKLPKDEQKKARQSSKAINFGRPGGLGDAKFITYSKTSYGVDFTLREAKEAKKKWLETYPEIKEYLADKTKQAMEWQSGKKMQELSWVVKKRLSDFLKNDKKKKLNFSAEEKQFFWELLRYIAEEKGDERAVEDIEKGKITEAVRCLTYYRACTLTGRIRNNTKYTDNANTSFQGLCADGAKLAIYNLIRNGYRVLAFVHDSFEVAVDPKKADAQMRDIRRIIISSMESVLGHGIPVDAEGGIATCWSK